MADEAQKEVQKEVKCGFCKVPEGPTEGHEHHKCECGAPTAGALVLQQKIQETKSSKRTSTYSLVKLPAGERPVDSVQLCISTRWDRNDRPAPEIEPAEIYEVSSYELVTFLQAKGKRLPKGAENVVRHK